MLLKRPLQRLPGALASKNPIKSGFFRTSLFTFRFRFPYDDNDLNQTRHREALDGGLVRATGLTGRRNQRENPQRRFMAEKRMTQTQLVRKLAESCEVSNKVARQLLDSVAEEAIKEVKKNGVFVVPGLGRLVRVDRKARMGRNPATGEAIKIPAKKVVKFRVAKAAKDAIVPPKAKK